MRGLVLLVLAGALISGCQNPRSLEVEYQTDVHEGQELVVGIRGAGFPSNADTFRVVAERCSESQKTSQVAELRERAEFAKTNNLSRKMQASVALMENFATDLENAQDCGEVRKLSENYGQLDSVLQRNTFHKISYNVHEHPLVKEQADRVRRDFGDLFVPREKSQTTVNGGYQAWSGYWYPTRKIDELIGRGSPLEKFDRILQHLGRSPGAQHHEQSIFHSEVIDIDKFDSWEGHCEQWSMASVIFPEPRRSVRFRDVVLTPADIKALLIKSVKNTPTNVYGIRFKGNAETDGTFQDLVPDAFHNAALKLFASGRPFIIDNHADSEVWQKPAIGMSYSISPDPSIPHAVVVKSNLYIVKERSELGEAGRPTEDSIHSSDVLGPTYEYRLYHEAQPNHEGQYRVIRGEWINRSFETHPDVIIVPDKDRPSARNPVFQRNIDVVERILREAI